MQQAVASVSRALTGDWLDATRRSQRKQALS